MIKTDLENYGERIDVGGSECLCKVIAEAHRLVLTVK